MSQIINQEERLRGLLLGTAVGDSLGLPAEGLNSRRTWKFFHGKWRHRFILTHGMVSDDTEHTVFVAQALISSAGSSTAFRRALAWRLRLWVLCLPAGIGFATLRSILKLWLGISPEKSGVDSAGNGAAMRSAIIGAYFLTSRESIDEFVKASTLLTHTDPRALTGALAVAHIAAWGCRNKHSLLQVEEIFTLLHSVGDDNEWQEILSLMRHGN